MQYYSIGDQAIDQLKQQLIDDQVKALFLVCGSHSYSSSGAQALLDPFFEERHIHVDMYIAHGPNPKEEDAHKGALLFNQSVAKTILAVGGGSCIDTAKLIKHFSNKPEAILIAIPTTAGTGSEATPFAVMYVDGVKKSVDSSALLPNSAYIYPPFTYGNSPYLTACTGFDALAQAIEAYWNIHSTPESDEYALKAMGLLRETLPLLLQNPSESRPDTPLLRSRLADGAYWAGRAIAISRTTAPHAFSYYLTSRHGYPHGHAVAATFPFFYEFNTQCPTEDYLGDDFELYQDKMEMMKLILALPNAAAFDFFLNLIGLTPFDTSTIDWADYFSHINMQRLKNNPRRLNDGTTEQLQRYLDLRFKLQ